MNKRNTMQLLAGMAGFALLSSGVSGQWIKVTDFQGMSPADFNVFKERPEFGTVYVLPGLDPVDEENYALYTDAEARGEACNRVHIAIPLETNVEVGTVATLKFDFLMFGPSYDLNIGLSPTPIVIDGETGLMTAPTGFPDFEAQLRMGGTVDVRDGDNFRQTNISPPLEEWMTIYLVIDHTNQTLEGYLRYGDGSTEKITFTVGDQVRDRWNFRRGQQLPLINFYLGSSNACDRGYDQGDIYLIDNIFIDVSGRNLDDYGDPSGCPAGQQPGPGIYADLCVGADGWLPDPALGWVFVSSYPYIYINNIQNWAYVGGGDSAGSWMYIFR